MCAALVCVSLADMRSAPFVAFLHHMPRLLSGEAFPVFRRPGGVATSLSVPGLVFKLKLFGLPNGSFEAMKIVGTIYTVIVLAITAVLGTREAEQGPATVDLAGGLDSGFVAQSVPSAIWAVSRAVAPDIAGSHGNTLRSHSVSSFDGLNDVEYRVACQRTGPKADRGNGFGITGNHCHSHCADAAATAGILCCYVACFSCLIGGSGKSAFGSDPKQS
jgi:hypothetical protein